MKEGPGLSGRCTARVATWTATLDGRRVYVRQQGRVANLVCLFQREEVGGHALGGRDRLPTQLSGSIRVVGQVNVLRLLQVIKVEELGGCDSACQL